MPPARPGTPGGAAPDVAPSAGPATRPVGKHARQAPAPAAGPAGAPPVAAAGPVPARHAGRPQSPQEPPVQPPGPQPWGEAPTAFLPRTPRPPEPTTPHPAPQPAPRPPVDTASPPQPRPQGPRQAPGDSRPLAGPADPATAASPRTTEGAPAPQASQDEAATAYLPKTPPAPPAPSDTGQAPPAAQLPTDQETVGLRTSDVRRAVAADETATSSAAAPVAGGRAERRRAAAARSGGRGGKRPPQPAPGAANAANAADAAARPPGRPLTRIEARQAARALKDSPGVVISRAVGELFISFGVLMLLFVTYQLWWTNVRADNYSSNEASKIQNTWKDHKGPAAGAFEPGQGFAIIHIPKLDVVAPIAQGVSKAKVLDHGMVGHYSEGSLKSAMPEDKTGNFALAGHRNTHGEPFRYINKLKPGDEVVVETQDEYYTYRMTRTLPQTSPANVSVISPIPQGSGFTKPGRYITLTTCTPEFTSTYRLIVWGKMVSEQPRSQGLPAALQKS
ncbi:class E sortase [Streptomyces sp. NRRL F-5126]|uniref:class E sortase n=1 Tax=Streptomyces sp. NRRL F-5126 TaxID=1463857 RepID=UPI003B63EF44